MKLLLKSYLKELILIFCIINYSTCVSNKTLATFNEKQVTLEKGAIKNSTISLQAPFQFADNKTSVSLYFTYQGYTKDIFSNESFIGKFIVSPIPDIKVLGNETGPFKFAINALSVGRVYLGVNSTDDRFQNTRSTYCQVIVVHSIKWKIFGDVIGWIYFAAWTISFYPQIVLNIWNKSVIGLNFDFILFNWLGFFSYSAFNVGLYWLTSIQELYYAAKPRSTIPVQLNDVIFSLHALAIVTFQAVLCLTLERGKQRISRVGFILFGFMIVYVVIILSIAASALPTFNWLEFLYYLSYLKMFITIIKYIPQAYMNYRRKSTVGWSIGNVLLDFTGGTLSILQMVIIAYNNDDWANFFSDPTKFGLGLFSVLFDLLFMVQHYILYRHPRDDNYEVLPTDVSEDDQRLAVVQ